MTDRVSELLGASPAQPQPAQSSGPDRVDELLGASVVKRGKYSESVMGQKVVPLTDRKNTPEVTAGSFPEADVPGILAYSAARILKGDDDAALGNILAKHLPDAEVLYDRDPKTGNSVPYLSHKGKAYYLNKPGLSLADVENLGGQVAQYLPAGKIASAGKTLASQLRRAFMGAGATSVAGDVAVDAMGGGTGVDIPKAAVNAVVAPIAQGIGSKIYPLLKGNRFTGAFGQLTPEGADALRRAGVDPSLLNAQGIAQINETLARLGGQFGDDAMAATQGNAAIAAQEGIRLTRGQASGVIAASGTITQLTSHSAPAASSPVGPGETGQWKAGPNAWRAVFAPLSATRGLPFPAASFDAVVDTFGLCSYEDPAAVLREMRGKGYGARLLQALLLEARRRGNQEVRLNAQRTAERFYAAHGFAVVGTPFDEVGIPHVEMRLSLV